MSDDPVEAYRRCAAQLIERLDEVIAGWIIRSVMVRVPDDWTAARRDRLHAEAVTVAHEVRAHVADELEVLVETDVEAQWTSPLEVLRASVGPANDLLADAGVEPPLRDAFSVERFPDDRYDLSPANFDDVDPSLHEVGLAWGAAKAHVVLSRHRADR